MNPSLPTNPPSPAKSNDIKIDNRIIQSALILAKRILPRLVAFEQEKGPPDAVLVQDITELQELATKGLDDHFGCGWAMEVAAHNPPPVVLSLLELDSSCGSFAVGGVVHDCYVGGVLRKEVISGAPFSPKLCQDVNIAHIKKFIERVEVTNAFNSPPNSDTHLKQPSRLVE